MVFDINDFDETNPGPFEWDVYRLATSFVLAGRDVGASAEAIQAAASYLAFNGTYPTDVAAIGEQIYVDDPELGAKLEIAGDPGTEDGYRFIGECNK